jgi:hypothetical protein
VVLPDAIDYDAGQQMSGSVFDVRNPTSYDRSWGKWFVRAVRLPAVLAVSASHQYLGETLRNNILLCGDIAARQKINIGFEHEIVSAGAYVAGRRQIAADIDCRINLLPANLCFSTDRLAKRSGQPVIVALWDRVVLVIVTTGAPNGQSQQSRA